MDNDGVISAEEFFGKVDGNAFCRKKMSRKRPSADADTRFAKMKIRIAMKARGVSRENAERLLAELTERKTAEEAERNEEQIRRPWQA